MSKNTIGVCKGSKKIEKDITKPMFPDHRPEVIRLVVIKIVAEKFIIIWCLVDFAQKGNEYTLFGFA